MKYDLIGLFKLVKLVKYIKQQECTPVEGLLPTSVTISRGCLLGRVSAREGVYPGGVYLNGWLPRRCLLKGMYTPFPQILFVSSNKQKYGKDCIYALGL